MRVNTSYPKDSLTVCRDHEQVGQLWLDSNEQFTFQYSEEWLSKPNALPISLAQPLQASPIDADKLRPFFTNLLPEDKMREQIANNLNLSMNNDFQLLSAIAGDCVGNISVFSKDQLAHNKYIYRPISETDLNEFTSHLIDQPLLAGEQGVRMSISGSEEKLPIFIQNNEMFLPVEGAPSSHIIKPEQQGLEHSVENEAFCTELGSLLGLNVVKGVLKKGSKNHYLVERSDRKRTKDGRVHRIHQEDFCQMLNLAPHLKYEKEGGPSLKQCFELIRRYSINPLIDTNFLLKWVVFNYLIGNHNAHAKNLAFVVTLEGPRLAPFCDLSSTSIYEGTGQPLAMKIGGEDRPSWIIARRWNSFAKEVCIKPTYVRSMLSTMANQISDCAQRLANEFLEGNSGSVVPSVLQVIKTRSRNAITNLRAASH